MALVYFRRRESTTMTVRYLRRLSVLVFAVSVVAWATSGHAQQAAETPFARQVRELSEPGGSFDTDNLISNERSYLHVIPALKEAGAAGGAYVGVGPDQNFSYIAASRPSVAYIIDVRRDNLLLQLLFKALFEISDTRAEYLSHLFGRKLPPPSDRWRAAALDKIVAQIDQAQPNAEDLKALHRQVAAQIASFGLALPPQDLATILRFHETFISSGLSLKFQSFGRAPRSYYPTYRDLLFETDRAGHQAGFMISEDDYQFVRGLELRNGIVPVVGDLAGPSALAGIGRAVRRRGETVSVLYASNVELYLFQNGVFQRFADTLSALPHNSRSLIIRSIFAGPGVWSLPDTPPGFASASVTQRFDDFIADYRGRKYVTYDSLVSAQR
jgi:hypothetical protein